MSTSSNEFQSKAGKKEDIMPKWIESFIGHTFFDKCQIHKQPKNDINYYCITCDQLVCRFCIPDHPKHELLRIYKHGNQNAVKLSGKEINCSKIQAYKFKNMLVAYVNPLPQNGPDLLIKGNGACVICKQKLTASNDIRFCSIACKFDALTSRRTESHVHEGGSSLQDKRNDEEVKQVDKEPKSRKRSRKGVPHRAPLF